MQTVKIAVCQVVLLDGDRSGNLARIENAIAEARDMHADVVCLPEMALLGWVNPDAHEKACPIPGKDSDRLCELAKKYGVFLCIGFAEKDGDGLYDSALLIDSRGGIALKHRKINLLSELMHPPYTAGDSIDVADTEFGRIGLLICADTHEDEILSQMATLKPDLLLVPYGYAADAEVWPEHGKKLEIVVCRAARKTGASCVGTNLVGQISHGPWKGRTYGGHSVVAERNGEVVVTGKDRDRDVIIVEVVVGTDR